MLWTYIKMFFQGLALTVFMYLMILAMFVFG